MNRAESLRIWKWISEGILNDPWGDEGPAEEYVIAQDFIKDVATKILKADSAKVDRGNHLIRALRLQGKYTKHELAVLGAMDLIEDFGHLDEQANPNEAGQKRDWNPGEKNRKTIDYIKASKHDPILSELIIDMTDEEIRKIILHLEKQKPE